MNRKLSYLLIAVLILIVGSSYVFAYGITCQDRYDWNSDALPYELNGTKTRTFADIKYYNGVKVNSFGTNVVTSGGVLTNVNSTIDSNCTVAIGCLKLDYNLTGKTRIDVYLSSSISTDAQNYSGLGFWYKGDGTNNYISWIGIKTNYTGSTLYPKAISIEASCSMNYINWATEWRYCYADFSTYSLSGTAANPIAYKWTKGYTLSLFNKSGAPVITGKIYLANISVVDFDHGSMNYQRWRDHTDMIRNLRRNEGVSNKAWLFAKGNVTTERNNVTILNSTIATLDYFVRMQLPDGGWSENSLQTHTGLAEVGISGRTFAYAFELVRSNRSYMNQNITTFKSDVLVNGTVYGLFQGKFYTNTREYFYNQTMERAANYSLYYNYPPSTFAGNQHLMRLQQVWWYMNYSGKYTLYNATINSQLNDMVNDWQSQRFGFIREENSSTTIGFDIGYNDVSHSVLSSFYLESRLPQLAILIQGMDSVRANTFNDGTGYLINGSRGNVVGNGIFESQVGAVCSFIENTSHIYQANYLAIQKFGAVGSGQNSNNLSGNAPFRSTMAVNINSDWCAYASTGNGFKFPQNYTHYSYDLFNKTSFTRRNLAGSGNITSISKQEFPIMLFAYDSNASWWVRGGNFIIGNGTDFIYSDDNGNFSLPITPNVRTYDGRVELSNNISGAIGLNTSVNNTNIGYAVNNFRFIANNGGRPIKVFNYELNSTLLSNGSSLCNGSSGNLNTGSVNITLNSGQSCYVLDNFNVTEGVTRQYSPLWFSSSTDSVKKIASNITDTLTVPVIINARCLPSTSIRYVSNSGNVTAWYRYANFTCIGTDKIQITVAGIEKASGSNTLYVYDSSLSFKGTKHLRIRGINNNLIIKQ